MAMSSRVICHSSFARHEIILRQGSDVDSMPEIWSILTPAMRLAFYPAVLLAVGGVVFSMLMARHLGPALHRYTGRVTRRAALGGVILAGLQVPAAAGNLAGDLSGALDPVLIDLVLETPAGAAAGMAVAGFMLVLVAERLTTDPLHPVRITGPGLVILSLMLAGHVTVGGKLAGMMLAVHLLGLGFWMGALLPLRAMSRNPDNYGGTPALADAAEAFGTIAGWLVPVLIAAGAAYAAILLGSFSALPATPYGNVLLVKAGLVGCLLGLAALNRWRLVPAIRAGKTGAAGRLASSIGWEVLVVLGILAATSLMTTSVSLPG